MTKVMTFSRAFLVRSEVVIMLNEEKQIKGSKYMLGTFIVAGLIIASYLLGRAGIHDNGKRVGDTGTKLEQAIGNQQSISEGIADSQRTVGSIGSGIERNQAAERDAAEAVGRAGSLVKESRKLAAANAEILAAVRARGPERDRGQD